MKKETYSSTNRWWEPERQWSGNTDKEKEESTFDKWILESQTDSEAVNLKRKKKLPLINEKPKLESDSKVLNPKKKTKPLLINQTQEDNRFVIDEEYDTMIEK